MFYTSVEVSNENNMLVIVIDQQVYLYELKFAETQ